MADNETGSGQDNAPKTVAHEHFQRVVEAKTGLEAQVKTLQADIAKLTERAALVDTLTQQVNEWKTKAAEAEGSFQTYTEFSGALGSSDKDVIDTFHAKWKALPEAGRPAKADWVKAMKEKPDEAPAVLRPWLSATQQQAETKTPDKKPAPKSPGAGQTPPGAPSALSAEQVRAIREEAVRTGDWSKWKEARKAYLRG